MPTDISHMKPAAPILLLVSSMGLVACGGGGGSDGGVFPDPGTDPVPGTPDPGTPDPGDGVPLTLLDGTWESDCFATTDQASSRRYVLSVTDTVFTFDDTTYGDTDCGEDFALRSIVTTGTAVEQLPEDGRDLADGIPIDFTVEDLTLSPLIQQVADNYNDLALCDAIASEWVEGVLQDISGCADETGTIDVDTSVPRTDENLFLVDDAGTPDARADDRLLLGAADLQSGAARPAAVGAERTFTRRAGTAQRPPL